MTNRTQSKYPYFDLTDIIVDFDLHRNNYIPLKPVRSGNILPEFTLSKSASRWQQFFNGAETHGPVLLKQLLSRPLVLFFYSTQWNEYGVSLLRKLNTLQHEVKANGANLLVITDGANEDLDKIVWDNSLSLSFYHDERHDIAQQFRIFSDDDPAWNKFSGIDVNVPLLASYVLSADGHVIFDYIDEELSGAYPSVSVVAAVNQAYLYERTRNYLSA